MTLSPEDFPVPLLLLNETDSTNRYLQEACKYSPTELTTVTARFQTAGRGQRGNYWESAPGENLLFSFILFPTFLEARRQFLLSQLVSVSIKEVLDTFTEGISIKWPNDIYWQDKKIAGILIENTLTGNILQQSIAGIGINVNQEVFTSPAPNPVSLRKITGKEYRLLHLLRLIMQRVIVYYDRLRQNDTSLIIHLYRNGLFRREGFHPYRDAAGTFEAELARVEQDGLLVLKDREGKERTYAFKEVEYLHDRSESN